MIPINFQIECFDECDMHINITGSQWLCALECKIIRNFISEQNEHQNLFILI